MFSDFMWNWSEILNFINTECSKTADFEMQVCSASKPRLVTIDVMLDRVLSEQSFLRDRI